MWWLLFLPIDEAAFIAKWTLIVTGIIVLLGLGAYWIYKPECNTPAAKTNKVVTYDTVSKTDSTIILKVRK